MLDHFETFGQAGETPLGRHTFYSPRQVLQKSKKKKFSVELEDKVNKREELVTFQRLFSIFEKPIRSQEALLSQVVSLNKACDGKDRSPMLQEVSSSVQQVRPHRFLHIRIRTPRRPPQRPQPVAIRTPGETRDAPATPQYHLRPPSRFRRPRQCLPGSLPHLPRRTPSPIP